MRIEFSKQLPSIHELTALLRDRFADQYTVRTSSVGQPSVIIGKSTLVGAQVSVDKNELSIDWTPPTIIGGILLSLGMTELAIIIVPFLLKDSLSYQSKSTKLRKEIGSFLKQQLS